MQLLSAPSIKAPPSAGLLTREVLVPGAFVLAILVSNYALAGLPNVKLFDLLVFVAGYSLGMRRGLVVAATAMLLYDVANPWGPAQAPLLLTKVGAEMGYAIAGAVFARLALMKALRLGLSKASIGFVIAALVTTVAYDLATNLYTAYFWAGIAGGTDYMRWIGVTLFGPGALLYMLLHVGSNVALFPVFGPLLIKGAEQAQRSIGMNNDA
ncbi:MAG: hypothetical protein O2826_06890 [Chloroflexi bacterium]|nr:hypothetical protein [Chloroflexota bacterium]MDA1174229.1 hypothetical protein [Chloroflexota bacterium]